MTEAPFVLPDAIWRPFSGKSTTPLRHDICCAHTEVGSNEGSIAWGAGAGRPYAHCYTDCLGVTTQCQSFAYRAAANLEGNPYVLAWETEDMDSRCFAPWGSSCGNVPAWTDAQVRRLILDMAWACMRFNIPPYLIPDTKAGRRGLAYHRQGVPNSPEWVVGSLRWTSSTGKCCPDWRRIAQFRDLVIPGVQRIVFGTPTPLAPQEDDDMPVIYECSADRTKPFLLSDGSGLSPLVNGNTVLKMVDPNRKGQIYAYDLTTVEEYDAKVAAASIADEVAAVTIYAAATWTELQNLRNLSTEQLAELQLLRQAVSAGN